MQIGVNTLLSDGQASRSPPPLVAQGRSPRPRRPSDWPPSAPFPPRPPAGSPANARHSVQRARSWHEPRDGRRRRSRAQSMAFLQAGVRPTAEAGLSLFIGPFCSAIGCLPAAAARTKVEALVKSSCRVRL